jgi:hypothetical protein
MNERKLIDEIKRLVNNDVIIGYYNGTTFTDDNGKTYASSYLVTNNSPIGRGFIVPYEGKWLVVVANNNQEVRKNIITSRRKISIEDKPKSPIDYLLTETLSNTTIRFIFDTSGSLDYFKDEYDIIFANIKETLTEIYGDNIDTYVTNSYWGDERWLDWMYPASKNEIVIAFINESSPFYHSPFSYLESDTFNEDRYWFERAYNLNPDRKFKGLIYAIEPLYGFKSHITFVFEKYNLSSYNLSYKFVDSSINAATVEQDFLKFIIPNTFYTIRDNKWKKYELPETVVLKDLNYYIDSNYVVIKSDEEDERFNQLTVLKDDVFTTYTYPEELPVLKTWRKDVFNTYNVINNTYSNKLVTMQQNRVYEITKKLNDIIDLNYIIEALSLKKSINLNIKKCRFTEDDITNCRKEPFKVKSPKLDTDIISPEEVNKQTIVSTYIKFQ